MFEINVFITDLVVFRLRMGVYHISLSRVSVLQQLFALVLNEEAISPVSEFVKRSINQKFHKFTRIDRKSPISAKSLKPVEQATAFVCTNMYENDLQNELYIRLMKARCRLLRYEKVK